MKLIKLTIENFRCYRAPITLSFDEMTTIIGCNDAGKSSIMDALDVFFNEKPLDKNDASKGGNSKAVTIICHFGDLPENLILDESSATNLNSEFLLNFDGELEIKKIYNCSLEKPKISTLCIRANHLSDPLLKDLLLLKLDDLKKRANELDIDLGGVNKSIKRELRNAIRLHVGNNKSELIDIFLVGEGVDEKGNAGKIWDGLKAALPMFALFKSDRQSSDQDAEAQDPLKIAIKEAISAKATELQILMDFVEQEVKKVATITLKKLREMDPAIASTLNPKFEKPTWHSLIKASITGDEDIPLNKRGSGVRRLILLNFFRAKAERAILEKQVHSTIYAVEEPETSQHPHNQRMLMRSLQQLSCGGDQVIVTTHTPMLARTVPSNGLRFISKNPSGVRNIDVGGTDSVNRAISESLGVLPDHTIKAFIIVEGVYDIAFLKNLALMFKMHGNSVPDLNALELAGELVFVPAGGANNLAYWASKLSALNRPEFHLFDRDASPQEPPKHLAKMQEVNKRLNCKGVSTSKREMENFVHHRAINAVANAEGIPICLNNSYDPNDDVPALLAKELNLHASPSSKWGSGRVKNWLANNVIQTMDAQMIAEIDPAGEMIGWLNDIAVMLSPATSNAVSEIEQIIELENQ